MAFLGLGSNQGDRARAMAESLRHLASTGRISILRVSALYNTAPVGMRGAFFHNAAARIATDLGPPELLACLKQVETSMGRRGAPGPHRSRRIDLDLLLYEGLILTTPVLRLPHPRIVQRLFVLRPLAELAPDLRLPGRTETAALLVRRAAAGFPRQAVRLLGPWNWEDAVLDLNTRQGL